MEKLLSKAPDKPLSAGSLKRVPKPKRSPAEIQACIAVLEELVQDGAELAQITEEQKVALMVAAGRLVSPTALEIKRRKKLRQRLKRQKIEDHEREIRAATGIRSARNSRVFVAPEKIEHSDASTRFLDKPLINARSCYVCKALFTRVHFFYDAMCPDCAEFNYAKRFQTASLEGQVAVITGSRLKIGYQASLMMLRAGATVIATTRFPVDSALRYAREKDFPLWRDRLHVYGLDLRHIPSVELFCGYVQRTYPRLDLIVNNAAQTVRRPPGFYAHLIANEALAPRELPENAQHVLRHFDACKKELMLSDPFLSAPGSAAGKSSDGHSSGSSPSVAAVVSPQAMAWSGASASGIGIAASAKLSQIPYTHDSSLPVDQVFPGGQLDSDLQQVDLREMNSWRLGLGEIPTAEMIELQLVNAIAPFVLCNALTPLMKRDNTGTKHIVNVSAMEGKFTRYTKTDKHPHTNMAKASLNMLTRTSAMGLEPFGIYMNSIDTGWVTDEDPAALSARKRETHDFQPPLDIVDGAARVCDPFFHGILTGKHWCGKFLKDYFPVDW